MATTIWATSICACARPGVHGRIFRPRANVGRCGRCPPRRGAVLAAAADIGASMGTGLPLRIVREWVNDKGTRHCASR